MVKRLHIPTHVRLIALLAMVLALSLPGLAHAYLPRWTAAPAVAPKIHLTHPRVLARRTPAQAHHSSHPGACDANAAHITVSHATVERARTSILCLLNRERAHRGLPPLHDNARLDGVAQSHSNDMVRRHYFDHLTPAGETPFARIIHAHYTAHSSSWWLGENIAWGAAGLGQPMSIVRSWMHSPPHRENILSHHFRDIGIGIASGSPTGGRGATYTTDFGERS
jgi:uncharacterized protein YkwD